jgi:hypothetical protein
MNKICPESLQNFQEVMKYLRNEDEVIIYLDRNHNFIKYNLNDEEDLIESP